MRRPGFRQTSATTPMTATTPTNSSGVSPIRNSHQKCPNEDQPARGPPGHRGSTVGRMRRSRAAGRRHGATPSTRSYRQARPHGGGATTGPAARRPVRRRPPVPGWPGRSRASPHGRPRGPEGAEAHQHEADPHLHGVLGDTGQLTVDDEADDADHQRCGPGGSCGQPKSVGGGAQRDHDHHDLEALEEHTLERHDEGGGVPPAGRGHLGQLGDVLGEDGVLVVFGLQSGGPEDGLAQPLQPEHQQQSRPPPVAVPIGERSGRGPGRRRRLDRPGSPAPPPHPPGPTSNPG